MRLTKASATGNDFIIIDLFDDSSSFSGNRAAFVRAVCDRHEGLGADGALFVEKDPELDFRWDFYNSDGGPAEMCGNAARAVALYFHERSKKTDIRFRSVLGPVSVRVQSKDRIEASLPALGDLRAGDGFTFVRAGVPHAVVTVPDARDWSTLRARALQIKARPEFKAEGVNVTFVRASAASLVDAVTFERGVEDFTLSCGTGAIAAAFAHTPTHDGTAVQVRVPGGELTVLCKRDQPVLIGPARLIARMDWLL